MYWNDQTCPHKLGLFRSIDWQDVLPGIIKDLFGSRYEITWVKVHRLNPWQHG